MMKDFTLGSPVERYAAVNNLILKTYNSTCLDYKYSKMIADMRKTAWKDSAAEGGILYSYVIPVCSIVKATCITPVGDMIHYCLRPKAK